ncbi:Autophagy- protein 33 [Metarhizium acridum]|uniref:Autophagy- protein 33 n=1 Tax=Metarhizium acridum TaxID=92637 RepID=UPI001C6C3B89|nr:Autophagy- protein 33 [Metarhizium acridum]
MVCAGAKAVSALKFVGTFSLGLLTGVSYSVSNITLPALLRLPSSASASQAIASLTTSLQTPLLTLTSLASAPLFLAFVLSPRRARHPYLSVYVRPRSCLDRYPASSPPTCFSSCSAPAD